MKSVEERKTFRKSKRWCTS